MMNKHIDTQEMAQLEFTVADTRTAVCPTCGDHSVFTLAGTQTWPPRIAEAAGLPPVMNAWHCETCGTTLLEPNINFDE